MMRALLLALAAGTYLFGIAGVRQHAGAANGDFGSISGVVTADDSGQPLEGICVDAWGPEYRFDWTDAAGAYTIQDIPPGEYGVVFSDCQNWPPIYAEECYNDKPCGSQTGDLVLVTPGANVTGIDAGLPKTGSISGVVTDEATGEPLEGICVYASSDQRMLERAVTDVSGQYRLMGAYQEPHVVRFDDCSRFPHAYTTEYFDNKADSASADRVYVTWGTDSSGIDARLSKVGSISGVVTDELSGTPLEGMCVSASPAYANVKTDPAGHYTIDNLDAGDYTLYFGDCANQPPLYLTEWYDDEPDCQVCDPVHLAPGVSVMGIDAALAKGGAITGTITDEETGDLLYAADVEVYDLSGAVIRAMFTGDAGRYEFGALPVGQYKLRFGHNYSGLPPHRTEWYDDRTSFESADIVGLSSGTVWVADAALGPALIQGDVDCNRSVNRLDALKILWFRAGLNVSQEPGCPVIGGGSSPIWGDVNCSGTLNSLDAVVLLRFVAGLPTKVTAPCPRVGAPVTG